MKIVSLITLSPSDAERIRAMDADIELVEAGGWFDGEFAGTWPKATADRYIGSTGMGTRAERDAMLVDAEVVIAGFPFPLDLSARTPKLRWLHQSPAGASNLRLGDIWGRDVIVTTSRGYGETLAIAEYAVAGFLHFAKNLRSVELVGERLCRRSGPHPRKRWLALFRRSSSRLTTPVSQLLLAAD